MISKIGPLVEAGKQRHLLILHVLGGTVGGATIGAILGCVGIALASFASGDQRPGVIVAILVVLLFAVGSDLRIFHLPQLTTSRQTPAFWPCAFGNSPASFAWGFDLGLGVLTRLPNQAFLALPLVSVLAGDLIFAVAAMTSYGLSRALTVAAALTASQAQGFPETCNVIRGRQRLLRLAVASTSLFVGLSALTGI
jgi:hypothetical protein